MDDSAVQDQLDRICNKQQFSHFPVCEEKLLYSGNLSSLCSQDYDDDGVVSRGGDDTGHDVSPP